MVNRLNYRAGLKAFLPILFGNELYRSGDKSRVRAPVKSEKLRRAKVIMIRFTKLIRIGSLKLDGKCNITGKGLSLMWDFFRIYEISTIIINCHSNRDIIPQRSKITRIGEKGTMGNPKGRKLYGFGDSVLGVSRRESGIRFFSSSNSIKPTGSAILEELREVNKVLTMNMKTIHIIADMEILTLAYETIKSSLGNMTLGNDSKTLDEIDYNFLKITSDNLKAGKFSFSPAQKVYVSKWNKDELQPLEVISPRDKIVQTAMLMVLEAIFEPLLLETSHGFRSEKSCHTALRKMRKTFSYINWVIKGKISKCYDSINHKILLNLIRKKINCDKTLALIAKSLRSPYKDNCKLIYPKIGIFQGSPLSPLFCNIFLHEFDAFIERRKKSFDKRIKKSKNPLYSSVRHTLHDNENPFYLEKKKQFLRSKFFPSTDFLDSNFRYLQYVRYADEFLIGIRGKRSESVAIKQEIKDFLSDTLSLTLDFDKTYITHFNKEGINFLKTFIKKERKEKVQTTRNERLRVRSTSRIRLEAPILSILKKGEENGLFKKSLTGTLIPRFCGKLVNLAHADIIRFYNHKIHRILNYYSLVDNKRSLGTIIHGLKHSCALTLALKLKFRHRAKVFKKFGKTLKCPVTNVEIYIPKSFK